MAKPFLLLQLRPEDVTSDDEYEAFKRACVLSDQQLVRVRMDQDFPDVNLDDYSAVIVGGGPSNVSSPENKKYDYQKVFEPKLRRLVREIVDRDFPYFGECYGLGILAVVLGGTVDGTYHEDVGPLTVELTEEGSKDPLLVELPETFRAFVGHKEAVSGVPPGSVLLARSATCPVHMIRVGNNVYATQFHPELDGNGLEIRIKAYKDLGYFKPEDAQALIERGHREVMTVPLELLRRFVSQYER